LEMMPIGIYYEDKNKDRPIDKKQKRPGAGRPPRGV
jgi:hypothetical protein